MKYKETKSETVSVTVPSVTGANIGALATGASPAFYSWVPSTWPAAPAAWNPNFSKTLKQIFDESILGEIGNVIHDIKNSNGDLQHRGHVVAISLMCALEAISAYPYRRHKMSQFVASHFPAAYRPHANALYGLYRNSMIHSWNLFEASIRPGIEPISKTETGILTFGLLNFFAALQEGANDFLGLLETNVSLQTNTLNRYGHLRKTAKA